MELDFFRREALDNKRAPLHGKVLITPHFSYTLISTLLFLWLVAAAYWLFTNSYVRKEDVNGWLSPAEGLVRIYPLYDGIIEKLYVAEGDFIKKGQRIAKISQNRHLASGEMFSSTLVKEYLTQKSSLLSQLELNEKNFNIEYERLMRRFPASKRVLERLQQKLAVSQRAINVLGSQSNKAKALLDNGHMALLEYNNLLMRELDALTEVDNILLQIEDQKSAIDSINSELQMLPNKHQMVLDGIKDRISAIDQKITEIVGQESQIMTATKDGTVYNLQVSVGYQVSAQSSAPLLTIVPLDSELSAELLVPIRSSGFLKKGQKIKIRYDAYPYQKFGLYSGEISDVSKTVLRSGENLNSPVDIAEPVYVASVILERQSIRAYGDTIKLIPGMTLKASVNIDERSFLEWMLEPLLSIKGRF